MTAILVTGIIYAADRNYIVFFYYKRLPAQYSSWCLEEPKTKRPFTEPMNHKMQAIHPKNASYISWLFIFAADRDYIYFPTY